MSNLAPWVVIIGVAVAGPYLTACVEAYWSLLLVPTLQALGVTAKLSTLVVMTLFNSIGALLAAGLLSLPLGLVVRSRAWVSGAFVGGAVVATSVVWLDPLSMSPFGRVLLIAESLSLMIGCALLTSLVSRQRARRHAA